MLSYFKKLHPEAKKPEYSHGPKEDAGMDLCSVEELIIQPGEQVKVDTGIAIQLPPYFAGWVLSRSGLADKYRISVGQGVGLIDPSYRDSIKVLLRNDGNDKYTVTVGQRIAQLVVMAYTPVDWQSGNLEASLRCGGGFGSTGV